MTSLIENEIDDEIERENGTRDVEGAQAKNEEGRQSPELCSSGDEDEDEKARRTQMPHHIPKMRPLAEPPIFDHDDFIENKLPSDIRFSKLFPNNPARWTKVRDIVTLQDLNLEYDEWLQDMEMFDTDQERKALYVGLRHELSQDWDEDHGQVEPALDGMLPVGWWEYAHLDQDGGTKGIEQWCASDWDSSPLYRKAWEKYGHLAPSGYEPTFYKFLEESSVDDSHENDDKSVPQPKEEKHQARKNSDTEVLAPIRSSPTPPKLSSLQKQELHPLETSPSPQERDLMLNFDLHPWFNAL